MGALWFLVQETNKKENKYDLDYVKKFMKMKKSDENKISLFTKSTDRIDQLPTIKRVTFTRKQLNTYRPCLFVYGYHQLSIHDQSFEADQPFEFDLPEFNSVNKTVTEHIKCMSNGEIYNYESLKANLKTSLDSKSDCEIIPKLWYENNFDTAKTLSKLDGDFTIVMTRNDTTMFRDSSFDVVVARDSLGIRPLYFTRNNDFTSFLFSSELKSIPDYMINSQSYQTSEFPIGSYWTINNPKEFTNYFNLKDVEFKYSTTDPKILETLYKDIETTFLNAVKKRTITEIVKPFLEKDVQQTNLIVSPWESSINYNVGDLVEFYTVNYKCIVPHMSSDNWNPIVVYNYWQVYTEEIKSEITQIEIHKQEIISSSCMPIGILYSGGFDSISIVSAVLKIMSPLEREDKIFLYSLNEIDNSILDYWNNEYGIKLNHKVVNFNSVATFIASVPEIINTIETCDPLIIREAILFSYLFNFISKDNKVKIILTGDGLDNLGFFKEFSNINDDILFHETSNKLISNISKFDGLRVNNLASKNNLQPRMPFLDTEFVKTVYGIHPKLRKPISFDNQQDPIEKWIIRRSLQSLLPPSSTWIRPSRISDKKIGNLNNQLDVYFDSVYTDLEFNNLKIYYKVNVPLSKEELYYRIIFDKLFPKLENMISQSWESQFE